MALRIEDYALIGNCESAALVALDGSMDWLCLPRFDSPAFFAALLGHESHGRWQLRPVAPVRARWRSYRDATLVLETRVETADGIVTVIDCMGRRDGHGDVVRIVRGEEGCVPMQMDLVIRADYGLVVPWVSRLEDGRLHAVVGPDRLTLDSSVEMRGEGLRTVATFSVAPGETAAFVLTWSASFRPPPGPVDAQEVVDVTTQDWRRWARLHRDESSGPWRAQVSRSLITLKALTHYETGGIVAAPTTSLPEALGGQRNWDYRYCWLRDSTLTLYALLTSGFMEEAAAWRDWLLRAVAGSPDQMQIMYGLAGERRLVEFVLPWLPGYAGSEPVRVGNAASGQFQLDVYGEVIDTLYQARRLGLPSDPQAWALEVALVTHLESVWQEPDEGIWEVRGGRRHFTHSKVMAWVAFDRAIRTIEEFGHEGPLERWRGLRDTIHAEVCARGYDAGQGCFTQAYGEPALDASLLLMPLVGFLPPDDPRIEGTVRAIETRLMDRGFVRRYDTHTAVDGVDGEEGVFLPCSFWLADNYVLSGRREEAHALFTRLVALANDVGLLAEEYDPKSGRQVGNFPQAFTHVALINTAHNLCRDVGPAAHRSDSREPTDNTL